MGEVSVIIPCYNGSEWIDNCINSCLLQGALLSEIIVVDDQSLDNSWEKMEVWQAKHPDRINIYKNPKKGGNNARNYGFAQSKGNFIQWLDCDDVLLENKFTEQLHLIKNQPDTDVVYSDFVLNKISENGSSHKEIVMCNDYNDFTADILNDKWMPPLNYLLKRHAAELLDKNLGWNPDTKVSQDREYFTVGAILGLKFGYAPGVFSQYNLKEKESVSSLGFMERIEKNTLIEDRFYDLIIQSKTLSKNKIKKYKAILNTIRLKDVFYNPRISLSRPFWIFDYSLQSLHPKIRLISPWLWFKSHLKYYFSTTK